MGCYLQADIYWKVSFVVLNTYKRKCQQTNIRLKWTIYYTTINNELFRFKRLMGFWTDITSLTSFASNSSLLLTFLAFDILLNSVFWSKNHAQNWKTNLNKLTNIILENFAHLSIMSLQNITLYFLDIMAYVSYIFDEQKIVKDTH